VLGVIFILVGVTFLFVVNCVLGAIFVVAGWVYMLLGTCDRKDSFNVMRWTKVFLAICLVLAILAVLVFNGMAMAKEFHSVKGCCRFDLNEWESDGIVLMKHERDGYYGCFGCGENLCVDPISGMILVEESFERHCGLDFKIVG
jgi:hypothetical protein